MPGMLINGRPVWVQLGGDNFFFYTSTRHWMVGLDYTKSTGCIHSKDMFLETIPVRGWGTFNLWTKDPQIRVEGEEKYNKIFFLKTLFRGVDRAGQAASEVMLLIKKR